MLEKAKEYAVMLCFDVKVDKDAHELADQMGVKIMTAEIIYHLFDEFTKHMEVLREQKKEESKMLAVFPCVLRPVAVFNKKDPIVIGVDVIEGNLRMGTPLAAVKMNPVTNVKDIISLGRVYVLVTPPFSYLALLLTIFFFHTVSPSNVTTRTSRSARKGHLQWLSRSKAPTSPCMVDSWRRRIPCIPRFPGRVLIV